MGRRRKCPAALQHRVCVAAREDDCGGTAHPRGADRLRASDARCPFDEVRGRGDRRARRSRPARAGGHSSASLQAVSGTRLREDSRVCRLPRTLREDGGRHRRRDHRDEPAAARASRTPRDGAWYPRLRREADRLLDRGGGSSPEGGGEVRRRHAVWPPRALLAHPRADRRVHPERRHWTGA